MSGLLLLIFTLLYRSSGIGYSLYLKCLEIWKSNGKPQGSDERDRLLVAYVASNLSSHVQMFSKHLGCFNIGIKELSNDPKLCHLKIPDTFAGVRELPEESRTQILD